MKSVSFEHHQHLLCWLGIQTLKGFVLFCYLICLFAAFPNKVNLTFFQKYFLYCFLVFKLLSFAVQELAL